MKSKKILIITYYWPPAGGPGVQRWYKLCKYLSKDLDIDLITLDPEKANYPVVDESLEEDFVNSRVNVIRTGNFDLFNFFKRFSKKAEYPISGFANSSSKLRFSQILARKLRSRFLIPDPRKFWNKYAIKSASKLISENDYEAVITTSPPHSSQLIGLELKKKFPKINWIVDLRDPWTDIYYYKDFMHSKRSAKTDLNYEKQVITKSDEILVVSEHMKILFENKYGAGKKTSVIPNGFDIEDIQSISEPNQDLFKITYTGTLAADYNISPFLNVLEKLSKKHSEIRLVFVGRMDSNYRKKIETSKVNSIVSFNGHVTHQKAIDYMHASNMLLLVIPDHEHNKLHVSGKIFEYMASKRPILCLGPKDGDAAEIIFNTHSGKTINYENESEIECYIEEVFFKWKSDPNNFKINNTPESFSRRIISKDLLKILDK